MLESSPNLARALRRAALLLTLLAPVAACDADGGGGGGGESAVIGPAGGKLTAFGGQLVLEVPPNALDEDVTITARRVATPPGGLLAGHTFELGPEGLGFAVPATLTITVDGAAVTGGLGNPDLRVVHWVPDADAAFELEGGVTDSGTGRVRAPIEHFSMYGVSFETRCDAHGTMTATYNEDRTIDLTWRLEQGHALVETARWADSFDAPANAWGVFADWQAFHGELQAAAGNNATFVGFRVRQRCSQTLVGPPSAVARVAVFGGWNSPAGAIPSLDVTQRAGGMLGIAWGTARDAAEYHVERKGPQDADFVRIAKVPGTDRYHLDGAGAGVASLTADTGYTYRVRASNPAGDGPWITATGRTAAAGAVTPGECPTMQVLLSPAVANVVNKRAIIDVTVITNPGEGADVYLRAALPCDGASGYLCEFAHTNWCTTADEPCEPYGVRVPPGRSTARLEITTEARGFDTEAFIVAQALDEVSDECRVPLRVRAD
ncbi:MAG: hypothetical protein KC635_08075 [Myxococcales bacterium]|nr:hypothetical protein [Myxococcales bacterium]